jgi:hypothetical protein
MMITRFDHEIVKIVQTLLLILKKIDYQSQIYED